MLTVGDRETVQASAAVSRSPVSLAAVPSARTGPHWSVRFFLIGLVVPWVIAVGPLNLFISRILLVIMLLPCIIIWISGRVAQIRIVDICMLLYSLWATFSLFHAHGVSVATQTAGIFVIESFGAYLLGRCYIRNAEQF